MAVVGEIVEMECRVRASPPHVSYTWGSSSTSSNVAQVRLCDWKVIIEVVSLIVIYSHTFICLVLFISTCFFFFTPTFGYCFCEAVCVYLSVWSCLYVYFLVVSFIISYLIYIPIYLSIYLSLSFVKSTRLTLSRQLRVKLRHEDDGLRSIGFLRAKNTSMSGGRSRGQEAECQAENDVGAAHHPCLFSILLIGK